MKQIRPFVIGLVLSVLAIAFVGNASAQTTTDGIAKVVKISGDARYFLAGDSTPHVLKNGMILKSGTTIQTASGLNNYVDIVLNDSHAGAPPSATPTDISHYQPKAEQDGIRIFENTVLLVDKLTVTKTGADIVTDTELDLKAGSILGTVKKLTPTSKYEVKIPNGVAGIRGTVYFISANGILRVLSGAVVIAYVGPDGNVVTQVVNAGEQFDTNTGLVTPINGETLLGDIHAAWDFHIFINEPTTFIAPDHRIYYVSPGKGHGHGHGQGGGGGGGG
jgi:hypothetical protein